MKIYLGGSVSGLTYQEAMGWRIQVKEMYPDVEWWDPFDLPAMKHFVLEEESKETNKASYETPVSPLEMFNWDVEQGVLSCDRVLLGFPTGNQASFGTGWEAGCAYSYGIPIITWIPEMSTGPAIHHPFLKANALIESNLQEAARIAVEDIFLPARFQAALGEALLIMRRIMVDRQTKYGPANITRNGVLGLLIRMGDKMSRIEYDHRSSTMESQQGQHDYHDESPEDAWLDLANYAGPIHHMLTHGTWGLPLMLRAVEMIRDSETDHAQP